MLSVSADGDEAVKVGTQDGGVAKVQTGEHVFVGMAEGVVQAV